MADSQPDLLMQKQQMEAALAAIPHGVAMFDANHCLVLANQRFLDMYRLDWLEPGTSFRDMLQKRREAGTFSGDPDARAVEFARMIKSGDVTFDYQIPAGDGRTVKVVARLLPDGGWVATHEDITQQRAAEQERDASRQFLRFVIDNIPASVWVKDAAGRYLLVNRQFEELFEVSSQSVLGRTVHDVFSGDVAQRLDERDASARDSITGSARDSARILRTSNQLRYTDARRHVVKGDDGQEYLICVIEDVTERRNAEIELDRNRQFLRFVIDNIPMSVFVKDDTGRYVLVNKGFEKLFGLDGGDVTGKTVYDLFPPEIADGMSDRDRIAFSSPDARVDEPRLLHNRANEVRYINSKRKAVRATDGHDYLISVIEDITERREKDEQIAYMANYDPLTDLPNRSLFRAQLNEALAHLKPNESIAVLYLDLDHFKTANDSLGHAVGDELLGAVAKRLRQCVRETDVVSRLGGDEFAVILKPRSDEMLDAATAARRILARLREPFELSDHRLSIDVSIGIALAPGDGVGSEELLRNADLALYRAKGDGRGTYRFYEPEMRSRVIARQWLEQDLRAALQKQEFVIHYQPILDLRHNRISSVEALLRWQHPTKGLILPSEFVQVAEETRLILPIGEWVMEQACRDALLLPEDVRVSVNFSQAQFASKDLVARIVLILRNQGVKPDRFELEITESHLIHDQDAAYRRIVRLNEMGFHIAIDDFGTGYSSLQHLATYPFGKIKIDKVFIDQITRTGNGRKIAESIIGLGVSLGMIVTAEGVETEEQLRLLKHLGCTEAQGFLVSRPQPIEAVVALATGRDQRLAGTA